MGIKNCLVLLVILTFISCDSLEPLPEKVSNKILFTSAKSGKEQLYMMNPDGSGVRQITYGEYKHYGGRFSPDGKKIICIISLSFFFLFLSFSPSLYLEIVLLRKF